MGQFSYMCKECGKQLVNNRDNVVLFRLESGKVKETLKGTYDGYGRAGMASWKKSWDNVVDDHFGDDNSTGIAAYHVCCFKNQKPRARSENDPCQGWSKK
jgi:hypothetical protein